MGRARRQEREVVVRSGQQTGVAGAGAREFPRGRPPQEARALLRRGLARGRPRDPQALVSAAGAARLRGRQVRPVLPRPPARGLGRLGLRGAPGLRQDLPGVCFNHFKAEFAGGVGAGGRVGHVGGLGRNAGGGTAGDVGERRVVGVGCVVTRVVGRCAWAAPVLPQPGPGDHLGGPRTTCRRRRVLCAAGLGAGVAGTGRAGLGAGQRWLRVRANGRAARQQARRRVAGGQTRGSAARLNAGVQWLAARGRGVLRGRLRQGLDLDLIGVEGRARRPAARRREGGDLVRRVRHAEAEAPGDAWGHNGNGLISARHVPEAA